MFISFSGRLFLALCMRRRFFARKVLCAVETPGDTGYIENGSFSTCVCVIEDYICSDCVWSRISTENTHFNGKNYSPSYIFIQSVSVWAPSALLSTGFQPFFSQRPQTLRHVGRSPRQQPDRHNFNRTWASFNCHRCQVLVWFLVCQTITQTHTPSTTKKTRCSQIVRPLKITLVACHVSFLDPIGLVSDISNANRCSVLSWTLEELCKYKKITQVTPQELSHVSSK